MIRTAAAVLSLALLATSANAAQFTVSTVGKTPAELRVAVTDAAVKACALAYQDDRLAVYKRDDCVRESVEAALAKAEAGPQTAMNSAGAHAAFASR